MSQQLLELLGASVTTGNPNSEKKESQPIEAQSSCHVLRDEENFIRNVSQFFNTDELSDVNISVGDSHFYAHRFVLAKSSDVFRTMLYGEQWKQTGEGEIILNESAECQTVFEIFLKFLYTAEMTISPDTAVGILCLADKYNVTSLKSLCVGYMIANSKSPNVHNALNWYAWAKALHLPDLVDSCTKTIAWNVQYILDSPEWLCMDVHFVKDVLNISELVVNDEFMLYSGLINWLLAESHLDNLVPNTETLLPLIRFPQMMVHQLHEIESSDFAKMDESKELTKELIGKAYRFRSLCPTQLSLHVSFDEVFYKPRNYLTAVVDTLRIQNISRFGIQVDIRMSSGPVPSECGSGDWKITYRRNGEAISLQVVCHESATAQGEPFVEVSTMVTNEDEKVIQVDTSPPHSVSRSKPLTCNVSLEVPAESINMMVILKPLPH